MIRYVNIACQKEKKWDGWLVMDRPLCGCGNLCAYKGVDKWGNKVYRARCQKCRTEGQRHKSDTCVRCGFWAEDPVQMDVDHIDNDPSNNEKQNLQTLCANCHRLKTKQNNDWKKNK
jgi:hypothetical protein